MSKDKNNNNFLIGSAALLLGLYLYKKSQTSITPSSSPKGLQPGISNSAPEIQDGANMISPSDLLPKSAYTPVPMLIPSPSQSLSPSVDLTDPGSFYSSSGIYF